MACFLACFGDGRRRKSRRQSPPRSSPRPDHVALHGKAASASAAVDVGVKEEPPRPPLHEAKALLPSSPPPAPPVPAEVVVTGGNPSKDLRELSDQKTSPARTPLPEKQVTPPLCPVACSPVVAAVVSPDPELRVAGEHESCSSGKKKVTFDMNVTAYEKTTLADQEEEPPEHVNMVEVEAGKHMQKEVLLPENHRYRNCSDSEEEEEECTEDDIYGDDSDEEEDFVDCKIDLVDEEEMYNEESKQESHESLFSLPMSNDHRNDNEVSSPAPKSSGTSVEEQSPLIKKNNARDRNHYVRPVLNPVQNLSQWKVVKAQVLPAKKLDKENVKSVPNIAASPGNYSKREVSLDARDTWLVSSDNSTVDNAQSRSPRSVSTVSRDERPVLGALTVDDLKQSSATSSPRRSPRNNREEAAILGTV
ncbi:hypothetical protein GUJ93_ZPchr0014g47193 [Zizania palustris]|uniref:Uncharacterized protein n=1 Tax=Zizania palustris TaxID=103762 RepID=A0A8J5TGT3_ZIZPA|nr:hypothetical protein GUJ93_ZPchr0014g47193 [Zizania palustris]